MPGFKTLTTITSIAIKLILLIALVFLPKVSAAEVDTAKLKQQCANITAQQRQMAKAAGYDVDIYVPLFRTV